MIWNWQLRIFYVSKSFYCSTDDALLRKAFTDILNCCDIYFTYIILSFIHSFIHSQLKCTRKSVATCKFWNAFDWNSQQNLLWPSINQWYSLLWLTVPVLHIAANCIWRKPNHWLLLIKSIDLLKPIDSTMKKHSYKNTFKILIGESFCSIFRDYFETMENNTRNNNCIIQLPAAKLEA